MLEKFKYIIREILERGNSWMWWRQRFATHVVGRLQKFIYSRGIDMEKEDWDHLLILDACRADLFEEVVGKEGIFDSYQAVKSNASATPEWLCNTFKGKDLGDTVYVTANPWVSREVPDVFHDIINIWVEEYDEFSHNILQNSDHRDVSGSIPASVTTQYAIKAAEEYPDKRIIVHYYQPHGPYIGNMDGTKKDKPDKTSPGGIFRGECTKEEFWKSYSENLGYVWKHAVDYVNSVDGQKVVTSDHGELVGEWYKPFPVRGYVHPPGLRQPEITKVPWAVFHSTERRSHLDDGTRDVTVKKEVINERLQDLGYKPS